MLKRCWSGAEAGRPSLRGNGAASLCVAAFNQQASVSTLQTGTGYFWTLTAAAVSTDAAAKTLRSRCGAAWRGATIKTTPPRSAHRTTTGSTVSTSISRFGRCGAAAKRCSFAFRLFVIAFQFAIAARMRNSEAKRYGTGLRQDLGQCATLHRSGTRRGFSWNTSWNTSLYKDGICWRSYPNEAILLNCFRILAVPMRRESHEDVYTLHDLMETCEMRRIHASVWISMNYGLSVFCLLPVYSGMFYKRNKICATSISRMLHQRTRPRTSDRRVGSVSYGKCPRHLPPFSSPILSRSPLECFLMEAWAGGHLSVRPSWGRLEARGKESACLNMLHFTAKWVNVRPVQRPGGAGAQARPPGWRGGRRSRRGPPASRPTPSPSHHDWCPQSDSSPGRVFHLFLDCACARFWPKKMLHEGCSENNGALLSEPDVLFVHLVVLPETHFQKSISIIGSEAFPRYDYVKIFHDGEFWKNMFNLLGLTLYSYFWSVFSPLFRNVHYERPFDLSWLHLRHGSAFPPECRMTSQTFVQNERNWRRTALTDYLLLPLQRPNKAKARKG